MGKSGELALSGGGRDPKRKGCYGAAAMTQMAASRSGQSGEMLKALEISDCRGQGSPTGDGSVSVPGPDVVESGTRLRAPLLRLTLSKQAPACHLASHAALPMGRASAAGAEGRVSVSH